MFIGISEGGFDYKTAYNIDTESTGPLYSGTYKDTGAQYPDAIELNNGKIAVVYSVNKEDIKVSTFDKPTA